MTSEIDRVPDGSGWFDRLLSFVICCQSGVILGELCGQAVELILR